MKLYPMGFFFFPTLVVMYSIAILIPIFILSGEDYLGSL